MFLDVFPQKVKEQQSQNIDEFALHKGLINILDVFIFLVYLTGSILSW